MEKIILENANYLEISSVGSFLLALLFIVLYIKKALDRRRLYLRFKEVIDIESERGKIEKDFEKRTKEIKRLN